MTRTNTPTASHVMASILGPTAVLGWATFLVSLGIEFLDPHFYASMMADIMPPLYQNGGHVYQTIRHVLYTASITGGVSLLGLSYWLQMHARIW